MISSPSITPLEPVWRAYKLSPVSCVWLSQYLQMRYRARSSVVSTPILDTVWFTNGSLILLSWLIVSGLRVSSLVPGDGLERVRCYRISSVRPQSNVGGCGGSCVLPPSDTNTTGHYRHGSMTPCRTRSVLLVRSKENTPVLKGCGGWGMGFDSQASISKEMMEPFDGVETRRE